MNTFAKRLLACLLLCLLLVLSGAGMAQETDTSDWITFLLLCNEGMLNESGNVGNTIIVLSMNPELGVIKEMSMLWNTFIEYPGYETPQLLDQPFRVGGPEESLKLFNENFGLNISSYMSLNFLNLAGIIDAFGGVTVDVTRAERNALNGMVSSKIENALTTLGDESLDDTMFNALKDQYYLTDYGPETKLSGMQAVGYGWLQYDSVANCCMRELEVVAQLFFQLRNYVEQRVSFHRDSEPPGPDAAGKRTINIDAMTHDDQRFLLELVAPVFQRSYHNLTDEDILGITETIVYALYMDDPDQPSSAFEHVQMSILPLEYDEEQIRQGSVTGVMVDYEANRQVMRRFLYDASYAPMVSESRTVAEPTVAPR